MNPSTLSMRRLLSAMALTALATAAVLMVGTAGAGSANGNSPALQSDQTASVPIATAAQPQ